MEIKSFDKIQNITYEDAVKELETIVDTLEKGNVTLEESLTLFKKGVELTSFCNQKLTEARGIVQLLTRSQTGDIEEIELDLEEEELK
ncbi:MAG: exodeoxyribonuclease VII small subunit [Caldicoprobacterales bacterium]|jgi:exodeoxyribonuclease VII small subunit|nr:exodeoxyribonuclease VII small subunit [Clostridiales bacterium]